MKAITRPRFGEAKVSEIPEPTENVVKVHASSLNKGDWHMVMGKPFLSRMVKVRVVGIDIAGTIVGGPRDGQQVMADVGVGRVAGHAEFSSVPAKRMGRKPANISFEEAACIPTAGLTALQGLRDWGRMQAGAKVLVIGASGGVGSFAVQIAKILGGHITAMCSGRNAKFVKGLGADEVWDYTKRGIEGQFDLIFDVAASQPLKVMKRHLSENGVYVFVGGDMKLMWQAMFFGKLRLGKQFSNGLVACNSEDLNQLADWVEAGSLRVPITRTISLEEAPAAIVAMGNCRTVGKVAVKIR